MQRKTLYYVGGEGAAYSRADWDKLSAALDRFWENSYSAKPDEYCLGSGKHKSDYQTFCVVRTDHRPFVKEEINALSWFFFGVRVAHGIEAVPPRHKPGYGYDNPATPAQVAWNYYWMIGLDRRDSKMVRAGSAYTKARETLSVLDAREVFLKEYK